MIDQRVWPVVVAVSSRTAWLLIGGLLWSVAASAQLVTINSDTTINDNIFTTGIDVVEGGGGAQTTVTIVSPAQIGFTNIATEGDLSVRANDDSEILLNGGTLTGDIRLEDTSQLVVSDSPLLQSGSNKEVDAYDAATIDYSGATVSWSTNMQEGASLAMTGGMVTVVNDVIDLFNLGQLPPTGTIEMSGVTVDSRDLLDVFDSDGVQVQFTDLVVTKRDAVDIFDGTGTHLTWIGGSIQSDLGTPADSVDAFDTFNSAFDTVLLVRSVPIVGRDALDVRTDTQASLEHLTIMGDDAVDAFDSPQVRLLDVTITGDDAIDAFNSSQVRLFDVTIIGADAVDAFDSSRVELFDVTITGDDAIDVFGSAQIFLRNVVATSSNAELGVFSTGTATIFGRNFFIDGVPAPDGPVSATSGVITGTNLNGTPFQFQFTRDEGATVILVSERVAAPLLSPLWLLALALVLLAIAIRRLTRQSRQRRLA